MHLNLKYNNITPGFSSKKPIGLFLVLIIISNITFACFYASVEESKAFVVIAPLTDAELTLQYVLQGLEYALQGLQYVAELAIEAWSAISAEVDLWFQEDTIMSKLAYAAGYAMLIALLGALTEEIIAWVNGEGDPQFVNDWQKFVRDIVNEAGGKFVKENLGLGFLCEPFDMEIRTALFNIPSFREQATCTLDDIGGFFDSFTNGGWESWIRLTQEPQNNIFGAYLMAQEEKMKKEAEASQAATNEALAGAGFKNNKVCVKRTCCLEGCQTQTGEWAPNEVSGAELSCTCDQWKTKTPGKTISDMVSNAVDQGRKLLQEQIADLTDSLGSTWSEIVTPYLTAIAFAITNRVIEEGISAITGSEE